MKTREKILTAFEEYVIKNHGKIPSNIELANYAEVAKGAMYYHFKNKDDLIDSAISMSIDRMTNGCTKILNNNELNSLEKLSSLYQFYLNGIKRGELFLYSSSNTAFHQKILKSYITHLIPIVSSLISEGVNEKIFKCEYPTTVAEFFLTELIFSLDRTIFLLTKEELKQKMIGLSHIMDKLLETPSDSFSFLYKSI